MAKGLTGHLSHFNCSWGERTHSNSPMKKSNKQFMTRYPHEKGMLFSNKHVRLSFPSLLHVYIKQGQNSPV